MLKEEIGTGSKWVEYLLYKQKSNGDFIWLIEDLETGVWFKGEDDKKNITYLNTDKSKLKSKNKIYNAKYDNESYIGVVREIWGSFNWEVSLGDKIEITDYQNEGNKSHLISKEIYGAAGHSEVAFTTSQVVTREIIANWFGLKEKDFTSKEKSEGNYKGIFYSMVFVVGFILAFILNSNTNSALMFKGILWSTIALVIMILGMWIIESLALEEQE